MLDAVDEPAQRDPLAGAEGVLAGELGGDVERDGDGVAAQLGDVGDGEWMERRRLGHSALKCSNGSAHSRQRCNDLHAVAPKRDVSSVSVEPQRGQGSRGATGRNVIGIGVPGSRCRRRTRRSDPGGGQLAPARGADPVRASTPASAATRTSTSS